MKITVEELPSDHVEVIELVVLDDASRSAATTLRDEGRLDLLVRDHLLKSLDRTMISRRPPGMQIVMCEASSEPLLEELASQRVPMLRVCVIAGDVCAARRRSLARKVDALLCDPAPAVDASAVLVGAARALVANVTADHVGMPVDELYPVFRGAGELFRAEWSGADFQDILRKARFARGLSRSSLCRRLAAHLTLPAPSALEDAVCFARFVLETTRPDDFVWSLSSGLGYESKVSLVGAVR